MQNLIQFLFRNGVVLLFLVLEALCFYLIVQTNEKQNKIYHKSSAVVTAALNKQVASFVDYWKLRAVNDSLQAENAILHERLFNTKMQTGSDINGDSLFHLISAHVIKNSILSRNNYITLDVGSDDGIEPGMGVISQKGTVGIVIGTTRRYSKVMSILHSNAMISVTIKRKGYFGSLVWKSFNPTIMQMEAIPKHANLQVGDTIVTSGYSHIFPEGILIGVVDKFDLEGGDNFYRVNVKLGVDMSNIQSVYVIHSKHAAERDTLENPALNE